MRPADIIGRLAVAATFFAALTAFDLSAAGNTVCIHLAKGQKLVYTHDNHPMVVFSEDNDVTLRSDHKEVSSLPFDELHKVTFGASTLEKDVLLDSQGKVVALGAADFALVGFELGAPVSVISLDGSVMQKSTVDDSSAFVVSLDGYAKGVYVITVGAQSYKIVLK